MVSCSFTEFIMFFQYDSFPLELVHTISLSISGIEIFFVYGVTFDNFQLLKKIFCRQLLEAEALKYSNIQEYPPSANREVDSD